MTLDTLCLATYDGTGGRTSVGIEIYDDIAHAALLAIVALDVSEPSSEWRVS